MFMLKDIIFKMQVLVLNKDNLIEVLDIKKATKVIANSADKFKIVKLFNGKKQIVGDFIVLKRGEDLEFSFSGSKTLFIKNFYSHKNTEVEFPLSKDSVYTISSKSISGYALCNQTTLVYAQGEKQTLFLSTLENVTNLLRF